MKRGMKETHAIHPRLSEGKEAVSIRPESPARAPFLTFIPFMEAHSSLIPQVRNYYSILSFRCKRFSSQNFIVKSGEAASNKIVKRFYTLTVIFFSHIKTIRAGIAQLVEYKLPKLGVAGSSPVARSRKVFCSLFEVSNCCGNEVLTLRSGCASWVLRAFSTWQQLNGT
jgi:hypothetical protein